jgi:lysine 6-dehydrogenase
MGSLAVRELGREAEVEQVTIVGRNRERAEALAAEVGSHAQVAILDVQDTAALKAALEGHDVAVGALGPFYLYETLMAEAAIDAGIPYVSICDDYDATQAVLELDPAAKQRGVTVLTGMGWTPGITNICAKKATQLLDVAEKIQISWAGASADAEGLAVILHTMHIFTGKVPTFVDGTWQRLPAGSGRRSVHFPDPMGAVAVYHVGHPEPVTIPRFMPGVQEVSLRGGLTESFLTYVGIGIARLGLTRTPERRERLAAQMKPLLPLLEQIGPQARPLSGAHVEVQGMKDGQPARIELAAVDRMARLTSLPLVVGALMLGRGEIDNPGVIAPESPNGPDPDAVFRALAQYELQVHVGEVEYLEASE